MNNLSVSTVFVINSYAIFKLNFVIKMDIKQVDED